MGFRVFIYDNVGRVPYIVVYYKIVIISTAFQGLFVDEFPSFCNFFMNSHETPFIFTWRQRRLLPKQNRFSP